MTVQKLKERYEIVLLVVATVAAVALLGSAVLTNLEFDEILVSQVAERSKAMPEIGLAELTKASRIFRESLKWEGDHLFVSEPILEVDGATLRRLSHAPISSAWIAEHALPAMDPMLSALDPDGDLFTHLEEWQGKTDPNDPDSHPPMITKLGLDSIIESDLKLIFRGDVDGKVWQIDFVSKEKFPSKDMLMGMHKPFGPKDMFRLEAYQERKGVDAKGVPKDASEVTISYVEPDGLGRVNETLVKGQVWEMPAQEVRFSDPYDKSEFAVKQGASFKISRDPEFRYTLIEVAASKAIVRDQDGVEFEID
ncbi:MAG: hypothetical protein ACI8T1_003150 [Verrucomicrobiales bacterium]|jgi:hypothetical protein